MTAAPARRTTALGLAALYGLWLGLAGPSVPTLRSTFDLSYVAAAGHLSALSCGAFVGARLGPAVARRLGRRVVVRAALLVAALGTAVVGAAPHVAVSLVGVLAAGLGGVVVATIATATLTEVADDAEAEVARAQVATAVTSAAAAGLVAAVVALPFATWRVAWVVAAGVGVAAVVLRAADRLGDSRTPGAAPGGDRTATPDQCDEPTSPSALRRAGAVLTGIGVAVEWGVVFWAAAYLADDVGLGEVAALVATTLGFGGLVVGRLVLVRLLRHRRAIDVLRGLLAGVVVLGCAYASAPNLAPVASTVVALAALGGLCVLVAGLFPAGLALTTSAASADAQAEATGEAMAAGAVTGIVGPVLVGIVADSVSLQWAMAGVPLLAAVGLVVLARARRRSRPLDAAPGGRGTDVVATAA